MRIASIALGLALAVVPVLSQAADDNQPGTQGVLTDQQILVSQVQTDKRSVYTQKLGLTDSESRSFWPIYDEYESKVKKLDDRFLDMLNDYASQYDTLTDDQAAALLKERMSIEKDRMALKQRYTAKVAAVLPPKKALRYAQLETRIEILIRSQVYGLIPLAR